MDPLYEQMLRDEVIYLHSLWYQGPPRAAAPAPAPAPATATLQPLKTTQFKKKKKRRSKNTAPESPGAEWPCPASPPPPSTTAWGPTAEWPSLPKPSTTDRSNSQHSLISTEQKLKLDTGKALKVVREFLTNNNNADDDSDDDDAIHSSSGEDDDLMEEDYGREEYSVFINVFRDNNELREYYEKNFAKGKFGCLVCGAIGGKGTTKKFRGCLALVQHSTSIAKTKKRRAHRAFGQAVCKVLGWDIGNLPAVVSMLSDQPGEASGNGISDNKESFTTLVNNVNSVNNDALECRNEEFRSGISPSGDEENVNSITCPDAEKCLEDDSMVRAHNVQESAADRLISPSKTTQLNKQQEGTTPKYNSSSGAEWPCPTSPPLPSTTGWPILEPKANSQPPHFSAEEQLKLTAKHVHWKAIKVVREFLVNSNDNGDDDAIDTSSDEDNELMEEDCGREEYCFLFNVFRADTELREYYEKNFAKGEFTCLICGAVGGKGMTKKFKGCLPMVQHSITVANTKKRRAHRAFGQAVCKVLAWDINNLPAIISMLNDQSGEASGVGSGDNKESFTTLVNNVDSVNNDTLEGQNEELRSGISPNGDEGNVLTAATDDSVTCPDAGKNLENGSMVCAISMQEPAPDGLPSNSLMCPDVDENHNAKQPAPEELMINSLLSTDTERNLENRGVVDPHNVEDTASKCLRNVPASQQ